MVKAAADNAPKDKQEALQRKVKVVADKAVVVRRGSSVVTPLVAVLTTPSGAPLIEPLPRDTSRRENAIAGVVGEAAVPVRPAPEKLVTLALA